MNRMMFANQAPTSPQIADMVLALSNQADMRTWALVDMALLDSAAIDSMARDRGNNALAASPLAAFGEHAPHYFEMQAEGDELTREVTTFVRRTGGAPAISWIQTAATLAELQQLAGYLSQVRIEGRRAPMHCRFADTRVLPHLLESLSPAQQRRVANVVAQWHWFGRRGAPVRWLIDSTNEISPDPDASLRLDIGQFRHMRRRSEADAIFKLLVEQTPILVPVEERGKFHAELSTILDTADGYAVTELEDRLQFVVLALSCGSDFHRLSCLDDTWRALKGAQARLSTRMATWDDAMWQQLEQRSGAAA